jgi:hypothetical protein
LFKMIIWSSRPIHSPANTIHAIRKILHWYEITSEILNVFDCLLGDSDAAGSSTSFDGFSTWRNHSKGYFLSYPQYLIVISVSLSFIKIGSIVKSLYSFGNGELSSGDRLRHLCAAREPFWH